MRTHHIALRLLFSFLSSTVSSSLFLSFDCPLLSFFLLILHPTEPRRSLWARFKASSLLRTIFRVVVMPSASSCSSNRRISRSSVS